MSNVENLQIGNTSYPIRDKNTLRNLSSDRYNEVINYGTYNGETVADGEIFTCEDGAFKEFNDDVTYGGDKQLNFTMPYTWDITTFDFNLQNGNYGSMVYGRYYGDNTTLVIKDDVVIFDGRIGSNFISDNIKVYSMDLFNGRYQESSDGITWSSDIDFYPNIYSGVVSYGGFYTLGKIVLTRDDVAYSYADTMNGTWTQGSFPSGVSNAALMPFSDELRLLDKSTGKLYSTTDLTQSWTDTGETASLPSYMSSTVWQYKTIGDVVFVNQNMYGGEENNKVYCSTDKGKTYTSTNLPNGEYSITYVEQDGTFVAVRSADTSVYYTSIDGSQWSTQTPQAGTTIYDILIGGYNSAYTVSTTGASRIFTGAQHNRSLTKLEGSLPSQTGNSGKFLTTDGTNASWADVSGGSVTLDDIAEPGEGIGFESISEGNYVITGSIDVVDGVAYNYQPNSSLELPRLPELSTHIQLVIKYHHMNSTSTIYDPAHGQNIICSDTNYNVFANHTQQGDKLQVWDGNNFQFLGNYILADDTTYWIRADYDSYSTYWNILPDNEGTYTVDTLPDIDYSGYTLLTQVNNNVYSEALISLGNDLSTSSETHPILGSIDLNESIIISNDDTIWEADIHDSSKKMIYSLGTIFTGSTTTAAGAKGLVPAPRIEDENKFLCANGGWETVKATYDENTETINL